MKYLSVIFSSFLIMTIMSCRKTGVYKATANEITIKTVVLKGKPMLQLIDLSKIPKISYVESYKQEGVKNKFIIKPLTDTLKGGLYVNYTSVD